MRKTFFRTLAVTAIIQFAITRALAGQTVEEGRAERMWMMYPLNVFLNTCAWTLLFSVGGKARSVFRRTT